MAQIYKMDSMQASGVLYIWVIKWIMLVFNGVIHHIRLHYNTLHHIVHMPLAACLIRLLLLFFNLYTEFIWGSNVFVFINCPPLTVSGWFNPSTRKLKNSLPHLANAMDIDDVGATTLTVNIYIYILSIFQPWTNRYIKVWTKYSVFCDVFSLW